MRDVLQLSPVYKERVWGGQRLAPSSERPVGEAWVVYEDCHVTGGPLAGMTLGDVARQHGADLLGHAVVEQTGNRFPLLVKLLHSLEWLSVQVHPDDEQATRLEGPGHFGKTEAWHVIEADDGAQVVYGLRGNWSSADLERLITLGQFERALNVRPVFAGDTLFTPAGCVHAIGPGLFIYEVQQTSDITYRLFDWNRPASAGRELHLEKGLSVIGNCGKTQQSSSVTGDPNIASLADCEYFALDQISSDGGTVQGDTQGMSFHALTLIEGAVTVQTGDAVTPLRGFDSIVVPAGRGAYSMTSDQRFRILCSRAG